MLEVVETTHHVIARLLVKAQGQHIFFDVEHRAASGNVDEAIWIHLLDF